MRFKDEAVREEYVRIPALLAVICTEFEALSHLEGVEPTVTRVREAVCGSSGVHEAGRAVDFRNEHPTGKFAYSAAAQERIATAINARYARKDGKATVLFHSFNGGPNHAHVQLAADLSTYERGKDAADRTLLC